jgi:hyperosmotically inducible periplasmic protein
MKKLKWMAIAGGLTFLVACNRNSDNASSSSDRQNSQASEAPPASLPPTSRESNSSNRVYPGDTNSGEATAPDNTGRNTRDRSEGTLTPGDQGGSEADRETTRRIRRAITRNDQLSANAKNIKIITINGKVTLRGPVDSEQEKQTIDSIVKQSGVTSFDDQLEVKATNQ